MIRDAFWPIKPDYRFADRRMRKPCKGVTLLSLIFAVHAGNDKAEHIIQASER
jgi:hypothetical protein